MKAEKRDMIATEEGRLRSGKEGKITRFLWKEGIFMEERNGHIYYLEEKIPERFLSGKIRIEEERHRLTIIIDEMT